MGLPISPTQLTYMQVAGNADCQTCSNVAPPPPTKAERLKQRRQLIADARSKSANLPEPGKSQVLETAARFEQDNDAVEKAKLAQHAYQANDNPPPPAPEGWKAVNGDANALKEKYGLRPDQLNPGKESDFRAAIYEPDPKVFGPDAKPVLAYKGTSSKEDWQVNFGQGVGEGTTYYKDAMRIAAKAYEKTGGNIEITGHSLGGGMASAGAAVTGAKTTTFNAAGLHPNTIQTFKKTPADAAQVTEAYRVEYEILTDLQENTDPGAIRKVVASGAGRTALSKGLGVPDETLDRAAQAEDMADAPGRKHTLRATDANCQPRQIEEVSPPAGEDDGWWQRTKQATKRGVAFTKRTYEQVQRHLMGVVIDSLECEKKRDELALRAVLSS